MRVGGLLVVVDHALDRVELVRPALDRDERRSKSLVADLHATELARVGVIDDRVRAARGAGDRREAKRDVQRLAANCPRHAEGHGLHAKLAAGRRRAVMTNATTPSTNAAPIK